MLAVVDRLHSKARGVYNTEVEHGDLPVQEKLLEKDISKGRNNGRIRAALSTEDNQ